MSCEKNKDSLWDRFSENISDAGDDVYSYLDHDQDGDIDFDDFKNRKKSFYVGVAGLVITALGLIAVAYRQG